MPGSRSQGEVASPVAPSADAEGMLWQQLIETRDPAIRQRLINLHLPFAKMMAAKLYGRRQGLEAPFEDYLHYAALALIQAVDRYNPHLGASFQTFAQYRIEGAILNELPRLSEQHAQVGLISRLRRERIEALSSGRKSKQAGGKAKGNLFEEMVELAVGLSIGYMLEGSGMYAGDEQLDERDGYRVHAVKQMGALLQKLVELLPEKEKTVIKQHYFYSLGVEEIATHMQLSKGRISQLHKQGLKRLEEMASQVGLNLTL